MNRTLTIFILGLLEVGGWLTLSVTVRCDTKQDLKSEYVGKQCVLRNFYSGDHLEYDSNGKLTGGSQPGMWALDGTIHIEKLKLRPDVLQFTGHRLIVGWDGKQFYGLNGEPLTIEVQLGSGALSSDALQSALAEVFYPLTSNVRTSMPTYWRTYMQLREHTTGEVQVGTAGDGGPIFCLHVKGSATLSGWQNPQPVHTPDPPYSQQARSQRTQGSIKAAILIDRRGQVADLMLTGKPLGDGLDQAAAATIRKWTFKPATKDGIAQNVIVPLQVAFRLF